MRVGVSGSPSAQSFRWRFGGFSCGLCLCRVWHVLRYARLCGTGGGSCLLLSRLIELITFLLACRGSVYMCVCWGLFACSDCRPRREKRQRALCCSVLCASVGPSSLCFGLFDYPLAPSAAPLIRTKIFRGGGTWGYVADCRSDLLVFFSDSRRAASLSHLLRRLAALLQR